MRLVPVGTRPAIIANGAFATMRKKDSYMVEVLVGEDESEDIAVRRFMKQVVQSKVIEKLRARKHKETKIEAYKRRFRERCEARKLERELGITDPNWEELYGMDRDPKPFQEFFSAADPDDADAFLDLMPNVPGDGMFDQFGMDNAKWGGYIDAPNGEPFNQMGGYM